MSVHFEGEGGGGVKHEMVSDDEMTGGFELTCNVIWLTLKRKHEVFVTDAMTCTNGYWSKYVAIKYIRSLILVTFYLKCSTPNRMKSTTVSF